MKRKLDLGYLGSLCISVLLAFSIGAVILGLTGFDPLRAYAAMLEGAFSSARHVGDFLEYAMVLCLTGLACVLGSRAGIFNVGGEGQLLLGAVVSCQVGVWLNGLSPWLVIPAAALAAMVTGWRFSAAGTLALQTLATPLALCCLALGLALCVFPGWWARLGQRKWAEPVSYAAALALLVLCVMDMAQSGFAPFIYLQF